MYLKRTIFEIENIFKRTDRINDWLDRMMREWELREIKLAKREDLLPIEYTGLAQSFFSVKLKLLYNSSTPEKILEELARDPNNIISKRAQEILEQRISLRRNSFLPFFCSKNHAAVVGLKFILNKDRELRIKFVMVSLSNHR